jgi:hypothetical protein
VFFRDFYISRFFVRCFFEISVFEIFSFGVFAFDITSFEVASYRLKIIIRLSFFLYKTFSHKQSITYILVSGLHFWIKLLKRLFFASRNSIFQGAYNLLQQLSDSLTIYRPITIQSLFHFFLHCTFLSQLLVSLRSIPQDPYYIFNLQHN